MIIRLLADITGPELRRARLITIGCIVASSVATTGALCTLLPVLEGFLGAGDGTPPGWIGVMLALLAVGWLLEAVAMRAGLDVGEAVLDRAHRHGMRAIRELDAAELNGERASALRPLVTTAGPESVSVVLMLLVPLLNGIVTIPVLAAALFPVSPWLSAAALLGGLLLMAALPASRRLVAGAEARHARAARDFEDGAIEFAWAQPTLRSAGVAEGRLRDLVGATRSRGLRLLLWQIPGETLFSTVLNVNLLLFGTVAGVLHLDGALSGPEAAALVVILLRVVETVGSVSMLATPLASASRTLADIRALVRATPDPLPEPPTAAPSPADGAPPGITCRGVGARYPDGTVPLRGVDLTIPAGGTTVVVGASGSGKSTLLDVLAGLREADGGEIAIDGVPLGAAERRRRVSMVFQSTWLRPGSLRTAIGADDADETELAEVAETAAITDLVRDLPRGWDSQVGEGGTTLSGGERQRAGLARALLKPAGILLVDEGTSALDAEAEDRIVHALGGLRGRRTTVVVSHRPALLAIADQVVVMAEGRIVEAGPPERLRGAGGPFDALLAEWAYPGSGERPSPR